MYQQLFIGNKLVNLEEVDSTNTQLKELIKKNEKEVEGLVVITDNQTGGRGQQGNVWESEAKKNLTFSIFLRPNILIQNQFLLSKVISLGIIDFLENLGLTETKIKWPNDIYCRNRKIAGILIENSVKDNKICSSVVGVGLNVNQISFNIEDSTSVYNELGGNFLDLKELLKQLLFFIEKRYILLKSRKEVSINNDYLERLYWINESRSFQAAGRKIDGIIIGVNSIGKLQIEVNDITKEFDLKEIKFIM